MTAAASDDDGDDDEGYLFTVINTVRSKPLEIPACRDSVFVYGAPSTQFSCEFCHLQRALVLKRR